jgi:dCMP deaminase
VEALRTRPDFVMVFVDAPQRVRYERSLARRREGDPVSFEAFVAEEERQMHPQHGDPAAQALVVCREMADRIILNEATPEVFYERVVEFTSKALFDYFLPRPSWDEYFMMMAEVAATRGNCIKRRVGAVIVVDKQILSTGYNGTPKGIKNCYEGGCPRGAALADSGAALGECLGVHAEENAILQAASYGVSIRGGTLYCTLCPCSYCAKSIINAGIREVVYRESYAMDEVTRRLFEEAGIKFRNIVQPRISFSPKFARMDLKTPIEPAGEKD